MRKHFGAYGEFVGTIISYRPKRKLYLILYEDNDEEELDQADVEKYLIETPNASPAMDGLEVDLEIGHDGVDDGPSRFSPKVLLQ